MHAGVTSDVDSILPRADAVHQRERQQRLDAALSGRHADQRQDAQGHDHLKAPTTSTRAKGFETRSLIPSFPKLDLIVDVNYRMDTSAFYADVVLPAASFYEKWDLNSTDLTFFHLRRSAGHSAALRVQDRLADLARRWQESTPKHGVSAPTREITASRAIFRRGRRRTFTNNGAIAGR